MIEEILFGLAAVGIPTAICFKCQEYMGKSLPKVLRRNGYDGERALALNNFLVTGYPEDLGEPVNGEGHIPMIGEFEEWFVCLQEQYTAGLIKKKEIIKLKRVQNFLKGEEEFYN